MSRRIIDEGSGIDDGLLPPRRNPKDLGSSEIPLNEREKPLNPALPYFPKANKPLDINLYATKKTVAQGMMDLALLTANANQLRYVLESGNSNSPYYYVSVSLISLSILLQLLIGSTLIFLGRYDLNKSGQMARAEKLNNIVILGVFIITTVNVLISAFGMVPAERIDPVMLVDRALEAYRKEKLEQSI